MQHPTSVKAERLACSQSPRKSHFTLLCAVYHSDGHTSVSQRGVRMPSSNLSGVSRGIFHFNHNIGHRGISGRFNELSGKRAVMSAKRTQAQPCSSAWLYRLNELPARAGRASSRAAPRLTASRNLSASPARLEQASQQFGRHMVAQVRVCFDQAGNVGQVLLALAAAPIGVQRRPDLAL